MVVKYGGAAMKDENLKVCMTWGVIELHDLQDNLFRIVYGMDDRSNSSASTMILFWNIVPYVGNGFCLVKHCMICSVGLQTYFSELTKVASVKRV